MFSVRVNKEKQLILALEELPFFSKSYHSFRRVTILFEELPFFSVSCKNYASPGFSSLRARENKVHFKTSNKVRIHKEKPACNKQKL